MKRYTTCLQKGEKKYLVDDIAPDPRETQREKDLINLYPQVRRQRITGFGGAFTDSAGYVFSIMPEPLQEQFLQDYFSPEGLGYTLGRTSIDSCDFSLSCYASCNEPQNPLLAGLDTSRAGQYVLPMIQRAQATLGRSISMMLTPWSPPAFMKTNHSRVGGGELKEEYYGMWAEYICQFLKAYQAAGVNVCMLSSQNEPKAVQRWDSCILSGKQEQVFIRDHLYPALQRHGLTEVALLIWDHNKERAFDRAYETICDGEMEKIVSGIAVHWYSGDHFEALQMVHERFPDKQLVFSEACVEYSLFAGQNQLKNAQMYAHDLIGNLNHGLNAFIDWNLVLDEMGGPNHVQNFCDAPMMYNTKTGVLTKNLSYDYIGHFSRYIKPGAVNIGLSRFGQELEATAVCNPDSSICVVVMNPHAKAIPFFLRLGDRVWPIAQEDESISTCIIPASEIC